MSAPAGAASNNGPITDQTGQQILAAVQALTGAVGALTQELAAMGETLDAILADQKALAMSLQSGHPYKG